MLDSWDNGTVSMGLVFPNWKQLEVGSFDTLLCYGLGCPVGPSERILAVTAVNFGTATAADITQVYLRIHCSSADSGLYTMTYAGNYKSDSGTFPAWTWSGTSPELSGCADLCGKPECGGYFTMDLYVNLDDCPTDQATVMMGFPTTAEMNSWTSWGSIIDNVNCPEPQYDVIGAEKKIIYTFKEGPALAAPGDTVNYTIYYGKAGSNPLTRIVILDTQPTYTHYVPDSGNPLPDSGWDPNPGPPLMLQWTVEPVPGNLPAWGPTGQVTFSLSVDWGNGESFEPGSGDVAAPEGARLNNVAQVTFVGSSCPSAIMKTQPTDTVVRRFLMWMTGDNDILFSQTYGQPAEEIIYSVFIKNVSDSKTWWNVSMWDTVPAVLDVWCQDCGVEDQCVGWTMTPTGCAPASAGRLVSSGNTILTWKLDLPPLMTLSFRWKARVRGTAAPGDTAVNMLNVLEYGRTNIINGTGYSGTSKRFAHLAPIVLPTVYVGYIGYACDQNCADAGYFIDFFPLNKKTQFELRGLHYNGAGWASTGGVSGTIGTLIGDCLGGFPGGAGICGGGTAGCKAERIPARYGTCAFNTTSPLNFIYKVTSNSPVAWQLLSGNPGDPTVCQSHCGDYMTNAPSTTLTYVGLTHYMWRKCCANGPTTPGYGEALNLVNTGKDPFGNINPNLTTTVHLFLFDYNDLTWKYMRTYELDKESQAFDNRTYDSEVGPWRTLSSEGQLVVIQSFQFSDVVGCCCGCCGHNGATFMPSRETGNFTGLGTFYGYVAGYLQETKVVVGNIGASTASYEIYRYVPTTSAGAEPGTPNNLKGTSGRWIIVGNGAVPAGLAAVANPVIFGWDGPAFNASSFSLYKVVGTSGGPIQVIGGSRVFSIWGSGGQIHAVTGNPTGMEFWLHTTAALNGVGGGCGAGTQPTMTVNIFCPKSGMGIHAESEAGTYSATYTTTTADQCVSFINLPEPARKRNYKFNVQPAGVTGDVVAQYLQCGWERGYSAPFLVTGVHYAIILPPVAFSGQSFWITVVALDTGGGTKTNYTGITSFTATDPSAQIEGQDMAGYDYTWLGGEQGVKMFIKVVFNALGLQTIVAQDTQDGSISGLGAIMVVGADVKLSKEPKFSILSSGETIQFRVCWSNYSSATASNFVITDAVPMGTSYVPEAASLMFCGAGGPAAPTVTVAYGGASETTPGTFNTLTSPTQTAPANTRWLRWTIRDIYVFSTGCACFRAKVD